MRTRGRQQRLIQLAEGGGRPRAGSGAASAGRPRPAAGASISAPASGLLADVTAGPVLGLRVSQLGRRVSRKGELATQAEWVGKPEEHRCRRRASRGNTRGASRLGSALAGDRPVSRAWLPALLSAPCTGHLTGRHACQLCRMNMAQRSACDLDRALKTRSQGPTSGSCAHTISEGGRASRAAPSSGRET